MFRISVAFFMILTVAGCRRPLIEPQTVFLGSSEKATYHGNTVIVDKMDHRMHSNISCDNLNIDESCIILNSSASEEVYFLYQNLECEDCTMKDLYLRQNEEKKIILNLVSLGTKWGVNNKENETICSLETIYLGENSIYQLQINDSRCNLIQERKPEFIYTPIIAAIAIYILLAILWITGKYLHRKDVFNKLLRRRSMDFNAEITAAYSTSITVEDGKTKQQARQRLRSLDTVRGIAIVVMIFVNYGGGGYWFFNHALWNGLTVADLVFPWFIWMMGMSMALSLRSLLRKATSRQKIFLKILKRSIILFALGIMLNTLDGPIDLKKIRIPGVLQRFSISYFVVATMHLFFAKPQDTHQDSYWAPFRDVLLYWMEWIIMLALLFLYLLLTFLLHAPECPAGYLGPGGNQDYGKYELCTGGAAGYIDRQVLGDNHIYQKPSSQIIYDSTMPYDPEGILGFLTSIFLVFLGLQAGKILLTYEEWKARIIRWMSWAVLTGVLAIILCKASKNDGWIPVNKNLWSVSFIFATGSLAFILISLCYYFIDVKNWWTGSPFYYSGMNAILLYVGHEVTQNIFPWSWITVSTHAAKLAVNLWGTSLWVIISVWLFNINFFVTV